MPRTAGVSGRSRVWFSFRKPSDWTVAFMSSEYPITLLRQVALSGRVPASSVMMASPQTAGTEARPAVPAVWAGPAVPAVWAGPAVPAVWAGPAVPAVPAVWAGPHSAAAAAA